MEVWLVRWNSSTMGVFQTPDGARTCIEAIKAGCPSETWRKVGDATAQVEWWSSERTTTLGMKPWVVQS